jgi:two-component system, NarL family, invasion response regulator UvrY
MYMPEKKIARLALVEDHKLFRKGMITLIEMVGTNYEILFEADDGHDMQGKLKKNNLPDIILMDINMPGMDGFLSVQWLKKHFPQIKILVVSMVENEESIVRMLKLGVRGYLSKDVEPKELGEALSAIMNKGFYYTDFITGKLVHSLSHEAEPGGFKPKDLNLMSERESVFLELACSDITYGEIAAKMHLSPRTIDGYRDAVFDKLKVKSRIGMILYAAKHGLIQL